MIYQAIGFTQGPVAFCLSGIDPDTVDSAALTTSWSVSTIGLMEGKANVCLML